MIEEKKHAEFGASNSHRWLNCPGSIALCKGLPEPPESPYAKEGTEAHACLEFLLKNRKRLAIAKKTALKTYPADMVGHAFEAAQIITAEFKTSAVEDVDELRAEAKVDSSSFTCTGQFGTLDAAIVRPLGRLTVFDFKYGAGIAVDPDGYDGKGNSQLVYYALAVAHEFNCAFAEVELVVIQPRAFHESGNTTRRHLMTMDELRAWGQVFRDGVMRCGDKNAPLKAGTWCRFCPATVGCPELKENAMKQAKIVFSDAKGLETLPEPTAVKAPGLSQMLEACDKLETWIKGVRDHAAHVLEKGGTVDGFKLVQKRSTRKWRDNGEKSLASKAWDLFGDKAFTEPELLSPAQMEKLVKGSEAFVKSNTTNESSGTTLARIDDKRPEVKPISKVFAAVLPLRKAKK